jgi:hypothetical protein
MRAWAKAPSRAPDGVERVEFEDIDFFRPAKAAAASPPPSVSPAEAEDFALTVRRIEEIEHGYRQARRQLDEIHGSKMWKLWMAYLAVRRWLLRPFGGGSGEVETVKR